MCSQGYKLALPLVGGPEVLANAINVIRRLVAKVEDGR